MDMTDPFKLHNVKLFYGANGKAFGQVFVDGMEMHACSDVNISINATEMPRVTITLIADSLDIEVGALGGDIDVKK